MYDVVLLDLDGTVTDSGEGIINSVVYAIKKMGLPVPEQEQLFRFVGPPLVEAFGEFCGLSKEDALQAVVYYREYFTETGILENRLYDGMKEILEELQRRGKKIILATSKPEVYARRIIKHFDLESCFDSIGGALMTEERNTKTAVIRYVLQENHLTDLSRVVMVGDRKHDVEGARNCQIPCIGALYGYGTEEELEEAGAVAIAETPEDLLRLI